MLSELFAALSSAESFELAAEAIRVPASPLLRILAARRSARSEAFDLGGLVSSITGAPAASFATLLVDGVLGAIGVAPTTGAALGEVSSVEDCAAAL